jgi:hypothetical protein
MIQGLRYKLRMMGIPIDGPAKVLWDNMSVVHNTTAPESVLKKKSNAIAYHFVQENVAMKVIKIAYEPSESNLADILTKVQSGPVRQAIIRSILWWFKLQEGFADFPVLNRFSVGTNCICIIFVIACNVEVLILFGSLFSPFLENCNDNRQESH